MFKKFKSFIKDAIIYIILILIVTLFIFYPTFKDADFSEWPEKLNGIIGNLCIYLFGAMGFFDFAYGNGLSFFVPNSYIKNKEHQMDIRTKKYIYDFINAESVFLENWEEERVRQFARALGISKSELSCLRAEVIEAKLKPIIDIETIKNKLELILFSFQKQNVIVNLYGDTSPSKSEDVLYYIRFADLMHISSVKKEIASIMATFIYQKVKEKEREIDVIMTPNSGNYLLGYEVNKILGKSFIKMIPQSKIVGKNVYEGYIPPKKVKDDLHIIIVHDVLFSGNQIEESMDDIQKAFPDCKIDYVFSLIYRKVKGALPKLQNKYRDTEFHHLLEYTENEITQNLEKYAGEV